MAVEQNVALIVSYDGTDFAGWQVQPEQSTVQGELHRALAEFYGVQEVRLHGAGRTDSGVHALDQVAHFTPPARREIGTVPRALNHLLPGSIRVMHAAWMPDSFHARRSATEKTYRYRLVNRSFALPFETRWAAHEYRPLDLPAMRRAAERLVGERDFASFAAAGRPTETTVRDLRELSVHRRDGDVVEIQARAGGFLYKMVRNLAGFLIEVGQGRRPASSADTVLAQRDRSTAGKTAPARGLCLVHVRYPEPLQRRLRGA